MHCVPIAAALASAALLLPTAALAEAGQTAHENRFVEAAADRYAHGVLVPRGSELLFLGGQVGLTPLGKMPGSFEAQAEAAFANLRLVLEKSGMRPGDLVELTYYVVAGEGRMSQAYWSRLFAVRDKVLGPIKVTGALVYVPALYRPEALVEVSGIAARTAG